jgi:RNA recognition motif-containing protein
MRRHSKNDTRVYDSLLSLSLFFFSILHMQSKLFLGYGYVFMNHSDDASRAKRGLDNSYLNGVRISVEYQDCDEIEYNDRDVNSKECTAYSDASPKISKGSRTVVLKGGLIVATAAAAASAPPSPPLLPIENMIAGFGRSSFLPRLQNHDQDVPDSNYDSSEDESIISYNDKGVNRRIQSKRHSRK